MNIRFDQQSGPTYAIELDFPSWVVNAVGIYIPKLACDSQEHVRGCKRHTSHISHQTPISSHLSIPLKQHIIGPHLSRQILRRRRVLPAIEIIRPDVHAVFVFVVVSLKAIRYYYGLVV